MYSVLTEGETQVLWRQIGGRKLPTDEVFSAFFVFSHRFHLMNNKEADLFKASLCLKDLQESNYWKWCFSRTPASLAAVDAFSINSTWWALLNRSAKSFKQCQQQGGQSSWKTTRELKIILAGDHYKDAIKATNVDLRDYLPYWMFCSPCR